MKTAPVQMAPVSRWQIPWSIHVRAWQVYAAMGHGDQSAARIAERGGFGWLELAMLLSEENLKPFQRERLAELRARNAESL